MRLGSLCVLLVSVLFLPNVSFADDTKKKVSSDNKPFLTVRLVDRQGKPVAGAQTGMIARITGYDAEKGADWSFGHFELKSDSDGLIFVIRTSIVV